MPMFYIDMAASLFHPAGILMDIPLPVSASVIIECFPQDHSWLQIKTATVLKTPHVKQESKPLQIGEADSYYFLLQKI